MRLWRIIKEGGEGSEGASSYLVSQLLCFKPLDGSSPFSFSPSSSPFLFLSLPPTSPITRVEPIQSLTASSFGRIAVSSSRGDAIQVWEVESHSPHYQLESTIPLLPSSSPSASSSASPLPSSVSAALSSALGLSSRSRSLPSLLDLDHH